MATKKTTTKRPERLDIYTETDGRVWLRVWPWDGADAIGTHVLGDPDVLWVVRETDWETVLGCVFTSDWLAFLAREGIAPDQPFQVRVFNQRTYKTGNPSDGYEHDADWDVEVVAIEPWSPARVAESWESMLIHFTVGALP